MISKRRKEILEVFAIIALAVLIAVGITAEIQLTQNNNSTETTTESIYDECPRRDAREFLDCAEAIDKTR